MNREKVHSHLHLSVYCCWRQTMPLRCSFLPCMATSILRPLFECRLSKQLHRCEFSFPYTPITLSFIFRFCVRLVTSKLFVCFAESFFLRRRMHMPGIGISISSGQSRPHPCERFFPPFFSNYSFKSKPVDVEYELCELCILVGRWRIMWIVYPSGEVKKRCWQTLSHKCLLLGCI